MKETMGNTRLRVGRITLLALGMVFMFYSVLTATTPLLAEENYAGTTYSNLQATNPQLAKIIWHDHVGFGIVNFAGSLLVVILAWGGLARNLPLAWYSLIILGLTSLAFLLLAHVPFGISGFDHIGPGLILNAIYFLALAISRPRAGRTFQEPMKDKALRVGWITISAIGVVSMVYSVIIAATPLLGEAEYVGTTFANLQVANSKIANIIWHDMVSFGSITFGASLLGVFLAWKGLTNGSRLAWYSLLILGVALLVALPVAHFPIGNTSLVHIGPGFVLLAVYLVALAISAKAVFSKMRSGATEPAR